MSHAPEIARRYLEGSRTRRKAVCTDVVLPAAVAFVASLGQASRRCMPRTPGATPWWWTSWGR